MTAGDWAGGDPVSRALIDLSADRGMPSGVPVTSDLVELAQRHGLSAILHRMTNDPLAAASYSRLDARRSAMFGHLRRILERLDEAGVRAAVLKGAAVAGHYRDPHLRTFSDLDILIEEESLQKGLEILASDEAAAGLPRRRPKAEKRDLPFRDRSGMIFNVDVHWDLFAYSQLRGMARGASREGWQRATRVEAAFGPHWELPSGTETCFLAAHAILDHRFRLILLRDFVEIAQKGLSWDGVTETAGRWGLKAPTYVPLWMARHALGAQIPVDVLEELRPSSLALSYLERALPRVDLVRFDGHVVHPVNLACVLLADSPAHRRALAVRAPGAFPGWRRKVSSGRSERGAPRLLIVANTNQRRGAEVVAERLRDGLTEMGWVVDAVSLTTVTRGTKAKVYPLTDMTPEEAGRLNSKIVTALRRRIKSLDPDVVLASGGSTLRYGVLATMGLRSRLVYLGIGQPSYWIRSRLSAILNRMLLRRVHRVLAVSALTRDELIDLEPAIEGKVEITYTGVPDAMFRARRPRPSGPLRVVMVGSLSREKDPALAVRAVASVEGASLRLVGDGPLQGELRELTIRLGVDGRVEFAGSVDDVAPHLLWSDVLILTSRTEGLPAAILEAAAAGVPAVAVDVGGVREAMRDGVTGIVVPAGDVGALASALESLAGDPEKLDQLGRAATTYVKDVFNMDRTISRFADVLVRAAT